MVKFDIVTIFPAMFERPLAEGVLGRAIARGTIDLQVHDLRDFTTDRHRVVDDVPYGGGPGMVLKPEPMFRALEAIEAGRGRPAAVILTTPQGVGFTQAVAQRLSRLPHVVLVCGRYEGVDERVRERITEELSIGDYVLSGGELPALVVIDAVARLVPGVVGDEQSVAEDSFSRGLLDFPHYTRPAQLQVKGVGREVGTDGESESGIDGAGMVVWPSGEAASPSVKTLSVPDVLLSGNHAEIRRWRKRQAVTRTWQRRPDLLPAAELDEEEQEILRELEGTRPEPRADKGATHGRD